jgi:precorrin-6B methylase 2
MALTLMVALLAWLFGAHEAEGQMRGRAGFAPRSGAVLRFSPHGVQGFPRASGIGFRQTPSIVGPIVFAPRGFLRIAPAPVFLTPVAPVFYYFGRPFFPVFPRPGGVLLIDVPSATESSVITQAVPGVIQLNPSMAGTGAQQIPGRSPAQLAPFDPTPEEIIVRLLVLAEIKKGDIVYDLGSGDGRVVIAAAKKYGVKAIGFEIDPGLVKLARENVREQGVEKLVEIRQQDFMTADLSPATVVTLYLSHDGNLALRPSLLNQLKPGARVVSYGFDMGDWAPKIMETYRDRAGDSHLLYFWQISEPPRYGENSFSDQ